MNTEITITDIRSLQTEARAYEDAPMAALASAALAGDAEALAACRRILMAARMERASREPGSPDMIRSSASRERTQTDRKDNDMNTEITITDIRSLQTEALASEDKGLAALASSALEGHVGAIATCRHIIMDARLARASRGPGSPGMIRSSASRERTQTEPELRRASEALRELRGADKLDLHTILEWNGALDHPMLRDWNGALDHLDDAIDRLVTLRDVHDSAGARELLKRLGVGS